VDFNYRAARGDVEVEVRARVGISSLGVQSGRAGAGGNPPHRPHSRGNQNTGATYDS